MTKNILKGLMISTSRFDLFRRGIPLRVILLKKGRMKVIRRKGI